MKKTPAKSPERHLCYHADLGVLYLTVGKEPTTSYYLDAIPGAPRCYRLTKFGTRETYDLDTTAGTCECKAFLRHGRRNPRDSLRHLLHGGKLAACSHPHPRPASPRPVHSPVPPREGIPPCSPICSPPRCWPSCP